MCWSVARNLRISAPPAHVGSLAYVPLPAVPESHPSRNDSPRGCPHLEHYKKPCIFARTTFISMASLQQVVEQLALLAAAGTNGTSSVDASASSASRGPFDFLASTFKILFSVSTLRDGAILLVIGSLFETARRSLSSLWCWLINSFFITAVFQEDDVSFRMDVVHDSIRVC